MALRRAVAIAADQGFDRIIFRSDCLSLIQQLQSTGQDRSLVGSVVLDIKQMVASFSSSTFRHVHRSTNGAAHILARTCDVFSPGFISFYVPDCIRETICTDVV
jgi:hypothetical protein